MKKINLGYKKHKAFSILFRNKNKGLKKNKKDSLNVNL